MFPPAPDDMMSAGKSGVCRPKLRDEDAMLPIQGSAADSDAKCRPSSGINHKKAFNIYFMTLQEIIQRTFINFKTTPTLK